MSLNAMMDINRYKNDGWGLSKKQMTELLNLINDYKKSVVRIIEFGSGKSTEFLGDITTNGVKEVEVTTFDDNLNFSYKGNHSNVVLKIRPLVECSDENYEKMFIDRIFDKKVMKTKVTPLSTRQKNNFYDIQDGDLNGLYDIMILDGPNGNGRNISYLHIHNNLDVNSIVLIDDSSQYDFIPYFEKFFEHNIIYSSNTGMVDQWNNGGDYIITKITKRK
jgi:hypothetical protein